MESARLVYEGLQFAVGAAPSEFGIISCPPSTSLLSVGLIFGIYGLLGFAVPFHLGSLRASRLKAHPAPRSPGIWRALTAAIPIWLCAIMMLLVPQYSLQTILAWFAGILCLTAALSWTSGFRWKSADEAGLTTFAGIAMGLASPFLFMGFGWPMSLSLTISLWISVTLDLPPAARAQLPGWWNARHVPFVVLAGPAALLLGLGGPSLTG